MIDFLARFARFVLAYLTGAAIARYASGLPDRLAKKRAAAIGSRWAVVQLVDHDEGGVLYVAGIASPVTFGTTPMVRIDVPDASDGWVGTTVRPMDDVLGLRLATERECRAVASAEIQADKARREQDSAVN